MRTAEETVKGYIQRAWFPTDFEYQVVLKEAAEAAKAYARQALEKAAEEAKTDRHGTSCDCQLDEDSITGIELP